MRSRKYRPVNNKATPADVYFTSFELQQEVKKPLKLLSIQLKKYIWMPTVKEQLNRYLSSKGE